MDYFWSFSLLALWTPSLKHMRNGALKIQEMVPHIFFCFLGMHCPKSFSSILYLCVSLFYSLFDLLSHMNECNSFPAFYLPPKCKRYISWLSSLLIVSYFGLSPQSLIRRTICWYLVSLIFVIQLLMGVGRNGLGSCVTSSQSLTVISECFSSIQSRLGKSKT